MSKVKKEFSKKLNKGGFFGSSPSPFVGRFGYPHINVGILGLPEHLDNAWEFDAPRHWAECGFKIPQIVDFRSQLINSRFKSNIKNLNNKLVSITQEVALSSKPVDVEVELDKKPSFRMNFGAEEAPHGPNAAMKKAKLAENPKIGKKVEKVYSDTDLKATNALTYLYKHDYDENFLSQILSVGALGVKTNRKITPSRWSITATDDILSKYLLTKIRTYSNKTDFQLYTGGYLGNNYFIMFFPEVWGYELFETYAEESLWNPEAEIGGMSDYEGYHGRKDYASNCIGGYYAARLPICEKLNGMKRQGAVLALRFITGEYAVPLGVFVVREATRKALKAKPIEFASKELMLKFVKEKVKQKFGYDVSGIYNESKLLKQMRTQTKLGKFI